MSVQLNPYLNFPDGKAREAMEFYKSVFGGTLEAMTFGEMPDMPGNAPAMADLIMHSALFTDDGLQLMGADVPEGMAYNPPSSISLSGDEEERLKGYWAKLSEGAEIGEELARAPWGDHFGMLTDRYGVPWMVNIAGPQS